MVFFGRNLLQKGEWFFYALWGRALRDNHAAASLGPAICISESLSLARRLVMQEIAVTSRSKKDWVSWSITVVAIALLSIFGRDLQLLLTSTIDPHIIAGSIFALLFGLLFTLWRKRGRYALPMSVFIAPITLLLAGIAAVRSGYLLPSEVLHFLVFSWLGWISMALFGPLYGVVAIISVAVGDEILQYYLPNRYGDLHDVVINLTSGLVGHFLRLRC